MQRKQRRCRTCGEKVQGHPGPCGERCRNRDLMTFDEEPPAQNVEEEEDESEEESSDEEEEVADGRGREEDVRRGESGRREEQVRAKGGKTSTPKPSKECSIPALQYISHSRETITVLQSLTEQMCRMNTRMEEMENKLQEAVRIVTPPRGSKTVPLYRAKSPKENMVIISPPRERSGLTLASGERMQAEHEDVQTEQQRAIPGLRPIPKAFDVSSMKPHASVSEKTVKNALEGKYCSLDELLYMGKRREKEEVMETVWVNGRMEVRSKEKKKKIWDITAWLEAWGVYENIMTRFHGIDAYQMLHNYKMRIIELNKKYWWANVEDWDRQVREGKAGESIDFVKYDTADFCYHFDKSALKQVVIKCYKCGDTEHLLEKCPFRKASGAGAGGRSGLDGNYWNTGNTGNYNYEGIKADPCINFNKKQCFLDYCRKAHVCKNCGGRLPYADCRYHGQCAQSWHK